MATPTNLPAAFVAGAILTADQQNNLRGAFRVLQVVSATYSTQTSSSSSTFADTGLTATITPQSATSKVLVIVNQAGVYKDSSNTQCKLQLLRAASVIINFENYAAHTGDAGQSGVGGCGTIFLDSPATTSATIYKTQFASTNNSAAAFVQTAGGTSTITLMEISA
jgi:predicted HNH restriction endonuclease